MDGGDPETEVFELLADGTRLAIVRELVERVIEDHDSEPVGFADLRKAVGVDDAGKFNYHLDRLCDQFVRKEDGGYRPTVAGIEIVGAILAGTYTEGQEERTLETDRTCSRDGCSRLVTATYENGYMKIECPEHDQVYGNTLPGGAAEGRSMEEIASLAYSKGRHDIERACEGACFYCWGEMTIEAPIELEDHPLVDEEEEAPTVVGLDCARCGLEMRITPGACVIHHPAVVSFYHDHGVDIRSAPFENVSIFEASNATDISDAPEPGAIEITVTLEDERLRVIIDDEAQVVKTERTEEAGADSTDAKSAEEA